MVVVLGAVWARGVVPDDGDGLLVDFAVDGAVGVQELVGDVGQNGGAARGDPAFGHLDEQAGEKLPDVGAGGELGEFGEEFGGEVHGVTWGWLAGGTHGGTDGEMVKTKTKMGLGGGVAAAFAIGETMLAAALSRCSG